MLNEYNKFVFNKSYDSAYLTNSRQIVGIVTEVLHTELEKDGRHGACIDICQSLSKILERENIWCCTFSGSMTIRFAKGIPIPDCHFWSIDKGNFSAAHTWIFAPPFRIVDVAIGLQMYKNGEEKYLPKYVLEENVTNRNITPVDLINPRILPTAWSDIRTSS